MCSGCLLHVRRIQFNPRRKSSWSRSLLARLVILAALGRLGIVGSIYIVRVRVYLGLGVSVMGNAVTCLYNPGQRVAQNG